jgi:hypothetical protein
MFLFCINENPENKMSLSTFCNKMENHPQEESGCSFSQFVRNVDEYRATNARLQLYSLRHFIELYHDAFYDYHGIYPTANEETGECTFEVMCLVDCSVVKEHTMKKDMRKKYRKAGSYRRKRLREKYSYRNPLNRIHAYIIVQKSPGKTKGTALALNVVCSSNYSDIKGTGGYIMQMALDCAKMAGFTAIVLEVGNQEADERESEESEESDYEFSESEEEDDDNLEGIVDIIASKLWRISVRHRCGMPVYNIGEDYIHSIVHDYIFSEKYEYIDWEPDPNDEEYGYGGYYYKKGKNKSSALMEYYESYGFREESKVNTLLKCFSVVPFPSMIKNL